MELQKSIKALIYPGEQGGYVAECLEISVVTQGDSLDEVVNNLKEAVALHLEGEDTTVSVSNHSSYDLRKLIIKHHL